MLRIAPITKYHFPESLADLTVGELILLMVSDAKKPQVLKNIESEKDEKARLKYTNELKKSQKMEIATHLIKILRKAATPGPKDKLSKESVDFEDMNFNEVVAVYNIFLGIVHGYKPRDSISGFWIDKRLYGCDLTSMNERVVLNPNYGEYVESQIMADQSSKYEDLLNKERYEYLLDVFALYVRPVIKVKLPKQKFWKKAETENKFEKWDEKKHEDRKALFSTLPATKLMDFAFFLRKQTALSMINLGEFLQKPTPQPDSTLNKKKLEPEKLES